MSLLKAADALSIRTREAAFFMAKEFALKQIVEERKRTKAPIPKTMYFKLNMAGNIRNLEDFRTSDLRVS